VTVLSGFATPEITAGEHPYLTDANRWGDASITGAGEHKFDERYSEAPLIGPYSAS
jgi:hypothetical protein